MCWCLRAAPHLDFDRVKGLKKEQYDKNRVALTPGVIRDSIGTTYEGNVIIARVPPADEFSRGHDGTAIGITNTVWKFLDFFSRMASKNTKVLHCTYDHDISDVLPQKNIDRVREYFDERHVDVRTRFAIRAVDTKNRVAEFENLDTKERVSLPFRLLVLDLPVRAPALIAKNGLSGPGKAGYADVDVETLQHNKYRNVFAIGDCAPLLVPRSYGAIYAQTPVLAHNVSQYLAGRQCNARYDGYSSFPIQMSTWRFMWPEMLGKHHKTLIAKREGLEGPDAVNEAAHFGHIWDDSDWVYWKGMLQGFYVQSTFSEFMHWLVFTRAWWSSPSWFGWPEYPEGEMLPPELRPVFQPSTAALQQLQQQQQALEGLSKVGSVARFKTVPPVKSSA
jgi:hypothetical protein